MLLENTVTEEQKSSMNSDDIRSMRRAHSRRLSDDDGGHKSDHTRTLGHTRARRASMSDSTGACIHTMYELAH